MENRIINISIPFDFGDKVSYVQCNLKKHYTVKEGKIFGVTVFNRRRGQDIRIIFKDASAPISVVFKNRVDAIAKACELQMEYDKQFKRETPKPIRFYATRDIYWDNWGHFALVFQKGKVYNGEIYSDGTVVAETPYYEGVSDVVDLKSIDILSEPIE